MEDEDDDLDSIIAESLGISSEEVKARIEERAEYERMKAENEQFRAEKEAALQREQEAREHEALTNQLAAVNRIDPSITNVLDFEKKSDIRTDILGVDGRNGRTQTDTATGSRWGKERADRKAVLHQRRCTGYDS